MQMKPAKSFKNDTYSSEWSLCHHGAHSHAQYISYGVQILLIAATFGQKLKANG